MLLVQQFPRSRFPGDVVGAKLISLLDDHAVKKSLKLEVHEEENVWESAEHSHSRSAAHVLLRFPSGKTKGNFPSPSDVKTHAA